jgi:hypothetical protein
MRRALAFIALTALLSGAAAAFDFEPVKPLDVKGIDPALLKDFYGAYEVRDKAGKRRCRITLLKDVGIGGYQIEVAPGCDKVFPVMGDIAAWRLLENWTIDLVDPLRKTRVRFETPDNRYLPFGDEKDIAGMHELIKVPDKPGSKK